MMPALVRRLLVLWPLAALTLTAAPSRPNIIFILTDDQGYGDLSCTGNPILKTPNVDRLHDEGVRFTDFHVGPTCSPTRAELNTGRHEFRNGVTHTIYERERLKSDLERIDRVISSAPAATEKPFTITTVGMILLKNPFTVLEAFRQARDKNLRQRAGIDSRRQRQSS